MPEDIPLKLPSIPDVPVITPHYHNAFDQPLIDELQIAKLAVTTAKIDTLAVTTAKINDLAVTTAKINSLAVTTAKIEDANITTAKIDNLAVTEGKIGNLAVTNAKIKDLSADKIDAGTLTLGGSGNAVQLVVDNSSDTQILAITNGGMTFSNTGSPGIFFNSSGGSNPASIFCDGSSNLVFRAGSAETIYFQERSGGSTTLILNTSGRVVQVGTGGSDAALLLSPRSDAPSGQKGLMYYDSDDDHFYGHNGTAFVRLDYNP